MSAPALARLKAGKDAPMVSGRWDGSQGSMAVSKTELIEAIKGMSVLELSELVKELESTFGVSAAAPVMAAAAPAAGAGGAAPAAAGEEQTAFSVLLKE